MTTDTNISVSDRAANRIREIMAGDGGQNALRISVQGGGCSGFQYDIAIARAAKTDDLVIERDGARLFVDPVSLPFLLGAEVDWVEELIGASFKVKNPNAKSSCGCGVSFSV